MWVASPWTHINMTSVALSALVTLLLLGVITWKDVLENQFAVSRECFFILIHVSGICCFG